MTSLVKNIPIANFTLRGILPLLILIGCIVALFFVPDLLKVSDSHRQRSALEPTAKSIEREAPAPQLMPQSDRSPLDEVLESMSQPAQPVEKEGLDFSPSQPLTWDQLKADSAQKAVQSARSEAQAILKELKESHPEATQALFTMIGVLDLVSGEGSRLISASDAAQQLELADLSVAAALQGEGIDRSFYLRWMKVSLAPAIQSYKVDRVKYQQLNPFDPKLRLVQVQVAKIDPRPNSHERYKSRLEINGVVQGNDIKRLRLFRNGRFAQEVPFGLPDEEGLRHFSLAQNTAFGVWTFKAYDTYDGEYEKSYRFFPTVERFPRDVFDYVLPFDPSVPDPRLDALFKVSERKGPENTDVGDYTSF